MSRRSMAERDDHTILGSYWDGMAGGACLGFSLAVILYVVVQMALAIAAGRL